MKTLNSFIFALMIMLTCSIYDVSATNWYLSPTGNDTNDGSSGTPFKTLSKALSAASSNDVIHVTGFIDMTAEPSKTGARTDIALDGTSTYTTGGVTYNTWNVGSTLGIITLSKALTIIGDDKATCGFDGKNTTCIIRQDGTTTAILISYENLTFKNGKSADTSGGGGMYIRSAKASFTNCEFTSNVSGGASNVNPGGAVTIIAATSTFNTTRFSANTAKLGCGIYAQSGTITLDGCTIEGNDASGVGSSVGAGIYASIVSGGAALNLDVKNTLFKNNKVASNGGALYYTDAAAFASTLKFTNCAFISNTVGGTGLGGAAYIDNKNASATLNLSFINSTFYDNLVGGTSGGAMFVNSALTNSYINLINCTVTGNKVTGTTGSAGAGIRMLSTTLASIRRIYNCVIENNVGTTEDMSVINNYTDFVVQSDAYTAGTTLIIDKSFIAKSTNTNFATQFGTSNNVNYAAASGSPSSINNSFRAKFGTFNSSGNYFPLQSTSTAIGYGTTSYLTSLSPTVTTDQLGYTRPSPCNAGSVEVKTVTVSSNSNLSTLGTNSATEITVTGNELTIDQTSTLRSVTVNPGAKLSLSSGKSLTTGSLTLQSSSSGTATYTDANAAGGLTVTGTSTVQQYLGLARNWYISSPVSSAKAKTGYSFYKRDEANAAWVSMTTGDGVTTGDALNVGQGYIANLASGIATLSFTGTLNTGSPSITVYRTAAQATKPGFNLIGNPYPSYLNVRTLVNSCANLDKSIWYRTQKTNTSTYYFDTYNTTGGIGTNNSNNYQYVVGTVAPMQAFWVRVSPGQTSATVNFSNGLRSHASDTINPLKIKAQNTAIQPILRLQVSNGTNSDETVIYSNDAASNAYDMFDSQKMSNGSASIPEIYTVASTENLAINGLNSIPYDTEMILGFNTQTAGNFSLKASQISNFEAGTQVILKDYLDVQNPITTDLSDGSSYSFSSDATSNNTSRFMLIFHAPSVATGINPNNNSSVWISVSGGKISVNGTLSADARLDVFNELGQKIQSKNLNAIQKQGTKLPAGVYMISLTNAGKTTTKRILVD